MADNGNGSSFSNKLMETLAMGSLQNLISKVELTEKALNHLSVFLLVVSEKGKIIFGNIFSKKIVIEKEKRKKIEKTIENDEVIKEFAKIKKPLKDEKAKQVSEYEKKDIDVNKIKGLIAKQYENVGEVKKKTDGITQSEDNSMKLSKLSVTTEYAVRHQIYTCWSVPTGLPYSEDLLVTVKLNLEKNGIVKNFEMLDHVRMNTPGEGAFYQIAQSVINLRNPRKR